MSDNQSNYGEWLKSEIQVYQTYHNHKETMAWTATALFLAAGGALLSAMPWLAAEHQWAASAVIVLASLAIAAFVNMPFYMRWSAADKTDGLRAALTRLYAANEVTKSDRDVSTDGPVPGVPKFVAHEIVAVAQRKPRWRKPWWRLCDYRDPRWRSEIASYVLLFLMLASVIVGVWYLPPKEKSNLETVADEVSRLSVTLSTMSKELSLKLTETEVSLRAQIEELEHTKQMEQTKPMQVTEPRH